MEVFGLGLKIQEQGAATVEATLKRLGGEIAKTALTVGSITKAMQLFVRETAESQRVQAQLASALRATNGASGQTIEALNAQAEALMSVSAFGDEAIGSAQALLLMYTNISGEIYERTIPAILDLATRLEMDLTSAASIVGKALQDPANGLTALNRQTRLFSEEQQKFIKQLAEGGRVAEAQGIILDTLQGRVIGAAAAYRNTLGGALKALQEAFGNLFEASEKTGASMTGTVNALTDMLTVLRGPIQFVFTNFTKGLVTIASLVAQVAIAILRFFTAVGAAAATFIGAFGVLLPGVGDKIGTFIDDLNAKVASNDEYFAGLQQRLGDWRAEVVMGTTAANNLAGALGNVAGEGGGAGGRRAPTIADLGAREGATAFTREQFGAGRERRQELIRGMIPQFGAIALSEAQALAVELQTTFQETIGNALVGGIVGGIEQAVASGNISDGFKALSSMLLAGIGDAMIKFGTSTAAFSQFMAKITTALTTLNPAAGLAASLALIGVGAALKGAARGMFGGQGGGNAGSIANFGGNMGGFASATPTTQIIFGQTSATTAAGMQPRQAMNVTIIGPNDPQAQRALQEMMTKANSRGRIG